MWMKQLIGRLAGSIVEIPYSAAQNAEMNGTAVRATDEEIAAAGIEVERIVETASVDVLPLGYSVEIVEDGYDLIDPAGLTINTEVHRSLPAAISAAHDHVAATVLPVVEIVPIGQMPSDAPPVRLSIEDYSTEEVEGGFDLYDPNDVKVNDAPLADEAAVRRASIEHLAKVTDRTVAEVEAEISGEEPDEPNHVAVPANWKSLRAAERRDLAKLITGKDLTTAQADEAIEEYVTRPPA